MQKHAIKAICRLIVVMALLGCGGGAQVSETTTLKPETDAGSDEKDAEESTSVARDQEEAPESNEKGRDSAEEICAEVPEEERPHCIDYQIQLKLEESYKNATQAVLAMGIVEDLAAIDFALGTIVADSFLRMSFYETRCLRILGIQHSL